MVILALNAGAAQPKMGSEDIAAPEIQAVPAADERKPGNQTSSTLGWASRNWVSQPAKSQFPPVATSGADQAFRNRVLATVNGLQNVVPAKEEMTPSVRTTNRSVEPEEAVNSALISVKKPLPLAQVMAALAEEAGISYVDPGIPPEEQITFTLADEDPYMAFVTIAKMRGYEIIQKDGVITLYKVSSRGPLADESYTRTYPVTQGHIEEIVADLRALFHGDDEKVGILRHENAIRFTGTGTEHSRASDLIQKEDYTDDSILISWTSFELNSRKANNLLGRNNNLPTLEIISVAKLNSLKEQLSRAAAKKAAGKASLTPGVQKSISTTGELEQGYAASLNVLGRIRPGSEVDLKIDSQTRSADHRAMTSSLDATLEPGQALILYGMNPPSIARKMLWLKVGKKPQNCIVSLIKLRPVLAVRSAVKPTEQRQKDAAAPVAKK